MTEPNKDFENMLTETSEKTLDDLLKLPELDGELAPKYPFSGVVSYLVFLIYMILFTSPWLLVAELLKKMIGNNRYHFQEIIIAAATTLSFFVCRRIMMYYQLAYQRKVIIDFMTLQVYVDPDFAKTMFAKLANVQKDSEALKEKLKDEK